jgi:hypothetical protein
MNSLHSAVFSFTAVYSRPGGEACAGTARLFYNCIFTGLYQTFTMQGVELSPQLSLFGLIQNCISEGSLAEISLCFVQRPAQNAYANGGAETSGRGRGTERPGRLLGRGQLILGGCLWGKSIAVRRAALRAQKQPDKAKSRPTAISTLKTRPKSLAETLRRPLKAIWKFPKRGEK